MVGATKIESSTASMGGGAIWTDGGNVTLASASAIVGSRAGDCGGAVHVRGWGSLTLTDGSSVTRCAAPFGGAIMIELGTGEISDGVVVNGSVAEYGGA
eukprot:3104040-Prymnesium_polylepis.1